MSRKRNFFRLKTNKIVIAIILVGLIALGVIWARQKGIFAENNATGCTFNAAITVAPREGNGNYTGEKQVYALNKENYDKAKSGGLVQVMPGGVLYNGTAWNYSGTEPIYLVVHAQDGKVASDGQLPITCGQAKTVNITAEVYATTASISHKEIPRATTQVGEKRCVKYDNNQFTLFTFGSQQDPDGGLAWVRDNPLQFLYDLSVYETTTDLTKCSSDPSANTNNTELVCVTDNTNPRQPPQKVSRQEINNSPGRYQAADSNLCDGTGINPGTATVTSPTQLKCFGAPGISDPNVKTWSWFGLNANNKWQKVNSSGQFIETEYAGLPGQEANPTIDSSPCGNRPGSTAPDNNGITTAAGDAGGGVPGSTMPPDNSNITDGMTRCIKVEGVSIQLIRTNGKWKPVSPSTDSYVIPAEGITDSVLNSWLKDDDKKCQSNSEPLPESNLGESPPATGSGGSVISDGMTRCIKIKQSPDAAGDEITLKRKDGLWKPQNSSDDDKFSILGYAEGMADASLNNFLLDKNTKCQSNSEPIFSATGTQPGCPQGKKCVSYNGGTPACVDESTADKAGMPNNNPYKDADPSKCSFSTAPTALLGDPANPAAPTTAGQQPNQTQYKNKLDFTAFRESYAEDNNIVPMGGVRFVVKGWQSSTFTGPMNSVPELQIASEKTGITSTDMARCSRKDDYLASTIGRFYQQYNKTFTTLDHGPTKVFTQTINVPPGFYEVTYFKTGFDNRDGKICFQVGSNDGVDQALPINVLLYAQIGAEPPGIGKETIGGVWYDDSNNGRQEYKAQIGGSPYKYMSDYPWYGWQKDDSSFITSAPLGTLPSGLSAPGFNPWGMPGGNLQQYMSTCQNYASISLPKLNKKALAWAGAAIGFIDALGDDAKGGELVGRTAIGAFAGLALGAATGDSGINATINIGELNRPCQALIYAQIPPQCRAMLYPGLWQNTGYSGAGTIYPNECVSYMPLIQAMLSTQSWNVMR